MSDLRTDRRGFLLGMAAPLFVPSAARGANDRIVFGLIGSGLRGPFVSEAFIELGAKLAAICDVYELHAAKKISADAAVYTDYRRLLERKDIDAVLIATPDHHHAPMLKAALAAGKDVYLEKPMSHSITEGVEMIRAARATKQIVQIGMQRRSAPWLIEAKKLVDEGLLGKVHLARAQWKANNARALDNSPLPGKLDWDQFLGPAPKRPFEPMRFRRWRNFWDYSGGNMTDQGTHVMDVVQWFTNCGAPRSAVCHGGIYETPGSEVPDCFTAVFEYPDMMATWTLNYTNSYENNWSVRLEGRKATMILDTTGYRVYQEPAAKNPEPSHRVTARLQNEPHVQNFLDCIRSRQQPNAPVEVGHGAVCGPHLANIAFLTKRQAFLNPQATEVY